MFKTSFQHKPSAGVKDDRTTHLTAVVPDVDELLTEKQPQQVLHGVELFTTQCRHVRLSDVQKHLHTSLNVQKTTSLALF